MRSWTEAEVRQAAGTAGLPTEWADRLLAQLNSSAGGEGRVARFEAAHILYYFGALLIIGAMGWFVTMSWDTLPGVFLSGVGAVYLLLFGGVGYALSRRPSTFVPGGVLMTAAVAMTPLIVYGVERQLGWWPVGDPGGYSRFHPYIDGSWVLMEAVTVLMAGLALRMVRFPFITAPAAYALWYMSMDATELVFRDSWSFHNRCVISVGFGLLMWLVGFFAEGRSEEDFSFWFYLFGCLAFCGGLSLWGGDTQMGKLAYCLIHVALIAVGVLLQRRVFVVFGALGVFLYLGDEAWGFFRGSLGFSFALVALGVLLIGAGVVYKRHEETWTRQLAPLLPARLRQRQLRPS